MTGPRLTTCALGRVAVAASLLLAPLMVGLTAGTAVAGIRPPAADEDETPLSITLTAMTPSEIPRKGTITLTGLVSNTSLEPWTDINVSPIISREPITTRDELAEAAETAADSAVGDRLTDPGSYQTIERARARAERTVQAPDAGLLAADLR